MGEPKLLIDADILIYVAAIRNQMQVAWDLDSTNGSIYLDEDTAKDEVDEKIKFFQDKFHSKQVFLALSGAKNFRKKITGTYKKNRANKDKPALIAPLREHVIEKYGRANILLEDKLEADDMLGIFQTRWEDTILLTIDKDLNQIPGRHYNWKHDEDYWIDNITGIQNIFYQALVGDSTDGYKGCPNIGKKKAQALLESTSPTEWWDSTFETFKEANKGEYYFKKQVNLAFILREGFFDFENKSRKALTKARYLRLLKE